MKKHPPQSAFWEVVCRELKCWSLWLQRGISGHYCQPRSGRLPTLVIIFVFPVLLKIWQEMNWKKTQRLSWFIGVAQLMVHALGSIIRDDLSLFFHALSHWALLECGKLVRYHLLYFMFHLMWPFSKSDLLFQVYNEKCLHEIFLFFGSSIFKNVCFWLLAG